MDYGANILEAANKHCRVEELSTRYMDMAKNTVERFFSQVKLTLTDL